MAGFDWGKLAGTLVVGIPQIISFVQTVRHNASGSEKHADAFERIANQVPAGVQLTETLTGKDLFNDPVIKELTDQAIVAEKAALKAREALKAGILTKAQKPAA